ncbi:MAG: transcriptional repressor LexA [Gemmatimonas sp.]|nr:transcriptional repressor LexA [Gemmatimonas sp.]
MPEPLSKIERRILDYLVDYLRKNTYQPSIREIGKRFGIKSTKTVSEYLQTLADKGYIEREASRSRGVKILGLNLERPEAISVPFYGKIAAGRPALSQEDVNSEFTLDPKLIGSPNAFFLQVDGDSMEQIGILDGDMVLVEPIDEEDLQNAEVVAARLGGEATVKRYFRRGDEVVLEPANSDYAPILVREYDDFVVLGRVACLIRRFAAKQTQVVGG